MTNPNKMIVGAAPLKVRYATRLLDVATPVPNDDSTAERWLNGITWQPHVARPLHVGAVDICNPADATNPGYECPGFVEQSAFEIFDAFNTSIFNYEPAEVDVMLREHFDTWVSATYAAELLTAAASGGASLASTAHAPSMVAFGSAAVSIAKGIAVLEDDLSRTIGNATGVIHLSPGLLGDAWWAAGLERVGDRFFTAQGHEVVADAGYVDMKEPAGQGASAAMKEWIYASGPVRFLSTTPDLLGAAPNEFMDMTRDQIIRWLTSYGLLQFDPAPVTAVLVDY